MKASASYSVKQWQESTVREMAGPMKITKASVAYQMSGDLEGDASVEYLMFYRHFDSNDQHNSAAMYVGLIHFEGTVIGKTGTFVLEDQGAFEAGSANSRLRIAEGSGTGGLKDIHGTGSYQANADGCNLKLEYDFK